MCKEDNTIARKRPDLAKEWHTLKNEDLSPLNLTVWSEIVVWWKCDKCSHEWQESIYTRNRKKEAKCPVCASLLNLYPEISLEWHPNKNGKLTSKDVTPGSNKKVWWQCSKNPKHEWNATVNSRVSGTGCPYCSGRSVTKDRSLSTINPDLASEWHPTKNSELTPENIATGSNKKVWWQCKKNHTHEWMAMVVDRNKGKGCPACSGRIATREDNLAVLNPQLAKEWHPIKNGTLTPFDVKAESGKKVWWRCSKNPEHEWQTPIFSRNNGNGCPACSGRVATKENNLAVLNPQLAKEWHPIKNGILTPYDVTEKSNKKVWWKCSNNPEHEWETLVSSRSNGNNCSICANKLVTIENCLTTTNPELAEEWHPKKNGTLTPNKVISGSDKKVWWQCSKNPKHEWQARLVERKKGNGCPACAGKMVTEDNCLSTLNPNLAKEWHPIKNGTITPYHVTTGSDKKVWWQCSKNPEHEWQAPIYNRNKGNGCPACSGRIATKEDNLAVLNPQLAKEWHPEKNGTLTPYDVTEKSGKKVWWKCSNNPNHEWRALVSSRSSGRGCPECKKHLKTSFPEQVLFYYLQQIFHEAENGTKIEDSRKEMDISIPSLKIAIEYDGRQYHQDIEKDKEKDRLLHEQGWLLIRIREKGCPPLKNSTSILYYRKDYKEETLPDALQFILQTIISRYPLNDIQLQQINNLSVDIKKDRDAIKLLVAS